MNFLEEYAKIHESYFPNGEKTDLEKYLLLLPVDYMHDDMEKINFCTMFKSRLILEQMEKEEKLCDPISSCAVARWGFKGGREVVLNRVRTLIYYHSNFPYRNQDRERLAKESHRHAIHHHKWNRNNIFLAQKRELWSTYVQNLNEGVVGLDYEGLVKRTKELEDAYQKNRRMMHEQRQCNCFVN